MAARSKSQGRNERKRRKQELKKRKERAKERSNRQKIEREKRVHLADDKPDPDPLFDTGVDEEDDWEESSYDEAADDFEDDWEDSEFDADHSEIDAEIEDADLDDLGPRIPRPHIQSWWNKFVEADDVESIRLVREKASTLSPDDDDFDDIFPEAIDELEHKVSASQYAKFLEELQDEQPAVFNIKADWNTWSMVCYYLGSGREADADRQVERLADDMNEAGEPYFSIMSMMRLAGRRRAVEKLADAGWRALGNSELMPHGEYEIIQWSLFRFVQEAVEAGVTVESLQALHDAAVVRGLDDSRPIRRHRERCVRRLAGMRDEAWTRKELRKNGKRSENLNLLLLDFAHWLVADRNMPLLVADELRSILYDVLLEAKQTPEMLLRAVPRSSIEPVIAAHFGILSMSRHHAPAAVAALFHLYDFLDDEDLIDPQVRVSVQSMARAMWQDMQGVRKHLPCEFTLVEPILPDQLRSIDVAQVSRDS